METGGERYRRMSTAIPQNVHSYTGLYIGTTGNAWSLLSLAGVLEGKEWIQTVEYNYFN